MYVYCESTRGEGFSKEHFPHAFKQGILFQEMSREVTVSMEHILRKADLAQPLYFLGEDTSSHRDLTTCSACSRSVSGPGPQTCPSVPSAKPCPLLPELFIPHDEDQGLP